MSTDDRRSHESPGSAVGRVPLVSLEPDMVRLLGPDDRQAIAPLTVPVFDVSDRPVMVTELLDRHHAFAAVVHRGMLLHTLQIGAQPGMRVLGPGDVVGIRDAPGTTPFGPSVYRASASTQLALLGNDFLLGVRRSPRLLIGLHVGLAEQMERLTTQLVICQLPRVEDRILAMLWLLANTWGRVTAAGTILPLSLTHELLGALVGARRPTVTLALSELVDRGAVLRQDRGWLLLQHPVMPTVTTGHKLDEPRLLDQTPSEWAVGAHTPREPEETLAVLSDTVFGLREQHQRNIEQVRDRLRRAASSRARAAELRERIRGQRRLSRRPPPSS
jgi:CRP-like cAMP-binding protein